MTDSPRLAVALRLHQAWREDDDSWDGAALYLDEDTAKSHAARDYLGYEYGCSGDCDDEGTEEHASLPALTWEQAHGSWHLLADGTETLVRISLAPVYRPATLREIEQQDALQAAKDAERAAQPHRPLAEQLEQAAGTRTS